MNDLIALNLIHTAASEARSARPGAPVVPDLEAARAPSRQLLRRSAAAVLRTTSSMERRWADRLDPACHPAVAR
jgi:hypothetical protein